MNCLQRGKVMLAIAVLAGGAALPVRAGLLQDIGLGLGYVGFNIEGDRNLLSGGADFLVSRNFIGDPLDFSATDFALQGPISLSASAGTRFLETLDISFQTALDADATAVPLGYVFSSDVGGQSTRITGDLLIDANLSLNGFGFYDLGLTYSSHQNVERHGRFAEGEDQFDSEVGPISISGNIFADVLAVVTDPFFERTGQANPFAAFSGRAKLNKLIEASSLEALSRLTGDGLQLDGSLFAPGAAAFRALRDRGSSSGGALLTEQWHTGEWRAGGTDGLAGSASRATIPEPAVVLLMLLGLPLVIRRRL